MQECPEDCSCYKVRLSAMLRARDVVKVRCGDKTYSSIEGARLWRGEHELGNVFFYIIVQNKIQYILYQCSVNIKHCKIITN